MYDTTTSNSFKWFLKMDFYSEPYQYLLLFFYCYYNVF